MCGIERDTQKMVAITPVEFQGAIRGNVGSPSSGIPGWTLTEFRGNAGGYSGGIPGLNPRECRQ